jgi:hypothetical protein
VVISTYPPFLALPPKGFGWGWPRAGGGGGDYFDPKTAQGSANTNGAGSAFAAFPDTPGIIQGTTGLTFGKWYFEYNIFAYDIFSSRTGVGVGRLMPNLDTWFGGGQFSLTDPNGGGQLDGGGIPDFQAGLAANGSALTDLPFYKTPQGQAVGVAVWITDDFAPFTFSQQQLQPVPLVCVPCQELLIGPDGFGGFGR